MKKIIFVFILSLASLSLTSFGLIEKHTVSISKNKDADYLFIKSKSDIKKLQINYNISKNIDVLEEKSQPSFIRNCFSVIFSSISTFVKYLFTV
jgi:hypothetical protein